MDSSEEALSEGSGSDSEKICMNLWLVAVQKNH